MNIYTGLIIIIGSAWSLCVSADNNISESELQELKSQYTRPINIPFPEDNPYSKEKYNLGKILFFDPRLSTSGTQSCATCHNPSFAWGDGMGTATGHGHVKLGRKTPTTLNLAWDDLYFWDGRAESLEEQAVGPIEAAGEMNMDINTLVAYLKNINGYVDAFSQSFPGDRDPVSKDNIGKAIATYERKIVSGQAPFDRWIKGDEQAISESAKKGFVLFNKKANCASCHSGWNFSDSSFHDIGLDDSDIGRGKLVKNVETMQYAMKTVGLRNIDHRGPYMHNGSVETLEDVIEHYNGKFVKRDSLSDEIFPLHLTAEEKQQLVDFLHTLTSVDEEVTLPVLPR